MRIEDLVSPEVKQKLNYNNQPKQRRNRKKKHHEQLTRRDIEELMGVHRDTYKRVNGKVKRK